jgi:UDP-N-acetylglucosamine 2-epimerase (non-hydrolysing)|tara:strand:- start:9852 stop:11012 length:1161 start_codon:yes stop_codon:yes gene_type:complete
MPLQGLAYLETRSIEAWAKSEGRGAIRIADFLIVVGTRPEAIKLAPVLFALRHAGATVVMATTGQHPDLLPPTLAAFDILDVEFPLTPPRADSFRPLDTVSQLQRAIRESSAASVIVQGDTASALAGSIAASIEGVPLHHVEAGLRSHDWLNPYPEEFHRVLISRLATMHFAPTHTAKSALIREGRAQQYVHMVGNTVVDALRLILSDPGAGLPDGIDPARRLVILTAHRGESAGAPMRNILGAAERIAARNDVQLIYPVHPRTSAKELASLSHAGPVELVEPLAYRDFIPLLRAADLVITDSGGIQEEAAVLGTPLLCVRKTTERPEALQGRCSRLVGTEKNAIVAAAEELLDQGPDRVGSLAFGDGHAAARIADVLTRPGISAY